MPLGQAHRPPVSVRRRRALAGAALATCLVANVWLVTSAGAREPALEGAVSLGTRTAAALGLAPSVPLNPVETVPDASAGAAGSAPEAGGTSDPAAPGSTAADPAKVVQRGSGTFTVVPVKAPRGTAAVTASGRVVRYTVETEGRLGVDAAALSATVVSVLTDPRGWQTKDHVRFVNVSPASAAKGAHVDLHITLASPDTTDRLCAPLETRGQVSCHNGGRVVLNLRRWQLGADAYGSDVASYRVYLVNHEVGHGIGHAHAYCGGKGRAAPVMMQQTYGLKGCTAWPWPTAKPA